MAKKKAAASKAAAKPRGTVKGKRRKAAPQQSYISGLEPPRIKALDDKALAYRKAVAERQELLQEELRLKGQLMELMKKNGLQVYPVPDQDLEVALEVTEETVKVRKRSKAPAGDAS